jgi:hypothetical protein
MIANPGIGSTPPLLWPFPQSTCLVSPHFSLIRQRHRNPPLTSPPHPPTNPDGAWVCCSMLNNVWHFFFFFFLSENANECCFSLGIGSRSWPWRIPEALGQCVKAKTARHSIWTCRCWGNHSNSAANCDVDAKFLRWEESETSENAAHMSFPWPLDSERFWVDWFSLDYLAVSSTRNNHLFR